MPSPPRLGAPHELRNSGYSQLTSCSASEVAAMIEGLLRNCSDAEIEANYTDTHGASVVGFAFCHLLGFRLLPRLKNIGAARLYRPADAATYPRLDPVLTRPIRWELIAQQYGQLVQRVLEQPDWAGRLTDEDRRGLRRSSGRTSTPTAPSAST